MPATKSDSSITYAGRVDVHSRAFAFTLGSFQPIGRRSVALCFAIIFTTLSMFASDRILEDESDSTIVFRKVAVSGETFDEQYVLKRCREFLIENGDKKLVTYTLVPDQTGATIGLLGCDHCKPYPFWRTQYDAVVKEEFPLGEMLALDGNAVVRYRGRDGSVSEIVLAGSHPRPVVIGTFAGKIVHVGMSGKMRNPRTLLLQLYVVGDGKITADAGAQYIASFSHQMGEIDSTVELRSDPWFINEIWRTWLPLFEEHRGTPPNEQDFDASKTLRCDALARSEGMTSKCSWKSTAALP
jgi:hypothetical protein